MSCAHLSALFEKRSFEKSAVEGQRSGDFSPISWPHPPLLLGKRHGHFYAESGSGRHENVRGARSGMSGKVERTSANFLRFPRRRVEHFCPNRATAPGQNCEALQLSR
jgi:hypothetical protein